MFLMREMRKITQQLLTAEGKCRPYQQLIWNSAICGVLQKPSPPLSLQYSRLLHSQSLSKNLILKTNDEDSSATKLKGGQSLAIVFAWMKAKGKHLEKYCNIYLQKGYDVLTVSLSPRDLMFPISGSQVVAQNILDYLTEHKEYKRIIVHGFSVGAYMFGEFLYKLHQDKEKLDYLGPKFQGVIFDSAVDLDGIPQGFPRALAKNPYLVRALELYINAHLKLMHNVSTKHYISASQSLHQMKLGCPTLLLVSNDDFVGNPAANLNLAKSWKKSNIDVSYKCWDNSPHCSHFLHHPEEYMSELDKFFSKIGNTKS